MERSGYTKEEKEFIKKWGVPHDEQYDSLRVAFMPNSKIQVTALLLAKMRADAVKSAYNRKKSNNRNYI